MRFARQGPQRLVVDIADNVVADIGPGTWKLRAPTSGDPLFRRTPRMARFVEPEASDDFAGLRALVNVSDADFAVVVAWLVGAMFPGPHPILMAEGPQGSGKTTLANAVLHFLDPGTVAGTAPSNDRSWEVRLTSSFAGRIRQSEFRQCRDVGQSGSPDYRR